MLSAYALDKTKKDHGDETTRRELVGGTSKKQNWKGLGIAFVVIAIVCLFIAAAIFLTSTRSTTSSHGLIPVSEQDIFSIKIPKPWNGTWISDVSFSYMDTNDSIWIYNCDTLQEKLLFRRSLTNQEGTAPGIVSPSTRYILIPINKDKVHRYYTDYYYDLYENSRKIASIAVWDKKVWPLSAVLYSNSDSYFAFIQDFDIYIYDTAKATSIRVTTNGSRETVHNGLVEWIYEYEIFNRHLLLFWSPTDRYLAYVKIDLQNVSKTHFLVYDLSRDINDQYSIPYPKFGDKLPLINVYIYNIKSGKSFRVPRPVEYRNLNPRSDLYIYHVVWYCDTCLAVVYGNRGQTSSIIQLYEVRTTNNGSDEAVLRSHWKEMPKGKILPRFLKPYFAPSGIHAVIIRYDTYNADKSMQKAYPHVVRIDFNQTYPAIGATSPGHIYADEIIHVDGDNNVYFTGSRQNYSLEREVYRWNYLEAQANADCISCNIANHSCGYANAQFSPGKGSYYILECYGPSVPYSTLHNLTDQIGLINENVPFQTWINNRLMPYVDFFSVPLDGKHSVGHGMIIFPPTYNPNVTIASYPVIVSINDRLYDQRVTKKYALPLVEFAHVTKDNISIVLFDSHGSTGQDEHYLKNNQPDWFDRQYNDYIKVAQHLKYHEKKFNETLNSTRFGLKARGPAAAIALKLLEQPYKDNYEYNCAFLDSPVADLSYYYAFYTERINGLQENIQSSRRLNIRNKSIAIVHGTADEEVHFKHSAALAKTFIQLGVDFQFKVYPDADHDFEKQPALHDDYFVFQRKFFQDCLGGRVNKERKPVIPEEHD
ncbi:unnamed protein product [Adineta ricciae]|uniref:Uncharacterized protein n=1 Tax=Adineta ricciae TaxID=249248 RepID=A0A816DYL3_ADIRI|nr:unnamed protein product [Adineta ricciae]